MSQMITPYGDHVCNPELVKEARRKMAAFTKFAFVPGGDPSMAGGGAPPPGGDPSMGGGAPPPGGDPSMMGPPPGGDPSMGGGAPPMDPSMMGPPPPPPGGGGDPAMMAKMDQLLQAVQGGGIGGQSGSNMAGQIKPKIDVNVAIMQMSKMIARIADALGVKIPASEMIATPNDLTQMASKQQSGGQQDAAMAPGGMPQMGGMPDMGGAPPDGGGGGKAAYDAGTAYRHNGLEETMNKAAAIASLRRRR